jgi:hypothetical protein
MLIFSTDGVDGLAGVHTSVRFLSLPLFLSQLSPEEASAL